jgi:chromosome segregation ATPase
MATSIVNGKKIDRAKTLMEPALRQFEPVPSGAGELYDRLIKEMRAQIEEKVRLEMHEQLTSVKEMAHASESAKAEAIKAQEVLEKNRAFLEERNAELAKRNAELSSENNELKTSINELKTSTATQIKSMETNGVKVNSEVRNLEKQVSKLQGQLEQARKKQPAQKIVQPAEIPSFKIEKVADAAGNLIGATVIPIGGH